MEGKIGIKINDRMAEVIQTLILSENERTSLTASDLQSITTDRDCGIVSPRTFKLLSAWNQQQKGPPLFSAIDDVQALLPKLKSQEKESDEMRKRREFLKMRQEERAYNKMIFGKENNPVVDDNLTMGNQFNSFKHQLSMGFNIIFAVLATFGMSYYIAGQMGNNSSKSMIYGLIFSMLVLILEMVLFIMRAMQIENTLERIPSKEKESLAKMQSGALLTPSDHPSVTQLFQIQPEKSVALHQDTTDET